MDSQSRLSQSWRGRHKRSAFSVWLLCMWSQETLKQILVLSSKSLKNLFVCMHLICRHVYVRLCMFVCTCFSECICCGQRTNMCMSACLPTCFIQRLLFCPAYGRIAGLRNSKESLYISSCFRSSAIKGIFYYM